ncbi:hypothetical protein DQ239_07440 [Blastococcus sp. TF02-09]|uniref:hypothetical protein n=1 Tax=Blastococcus sp. TF02-09 TaxID=2250576 RepID=UPI000DE882E5|nr:hypothetical protein [Blastococcus sp. TF02-9]RBY78406.1 hypothetical protein DQ239_07440 [Blastococcus sp. TF02-9]
MPVQDRMTPRNVYLYLVCLVALLVGLFAAVQLVQSAIGIAYPDATADFGWTAYTPLDEASGYLSEEQTNDAQRRYEIKETVTACVTLLLAGGIHVLHWRRAQRERSRPAE